MANRVFGRMIGNVAERFRDDVLTVGHQTPPDYFVLDDDSGSVVRTDSGVIGDRLRLHLPVPLEEFLVGPFFDVSEAGLVEHVKRHTRSNWMGNPRFNSAGLG